MAERKSNRRYNPKDTEQLAASLARNLTNHEFLFLRRLALGNVASFDFQVRIGYYIADFVFPGKMLVIELDGKSHARRVERDARRDAFLTEAGFTIWRIPNGQAQSWPLSAITKHERPPTGRGYVDALEWANGRHERGMRERGKIPQPKTQEERREDFYKRLVQITDRHQQSEKDRREMYARERRARATPRSEY